MTKPNGPFVAVVPAAGVGKRMKADCPKQYLTIGKLTLLEHTVNRLLSHPNIDHVVLVISANDAYFHQTSIAVNPKVKIAYGGRERVDSVLAGLRSINSEQYPWVLVHDAARPCVALKDVDALILSCQKNNVGGILATPVRDTMKKSTKDKQIISTQEREFLWHALTPQMYPTRQLIAAIESSLSNSKLITDEASAIEHANMPSLLVESSSDNLKITHPDDLALAEFILAKQKAEQSIGEEQCG